MDDAYKSAFYSVVKSAQEEQGYTLPEPIEAYLVMLLADHLDKNDFLPQDSFAEAYLRLTNPARMDAKKLGDTCLFVTGVFPEYGTNKGLDINYYSNIGISSYDMIGKSLQYELFNILSKEFVFLRKFISLTVKKTNQQDIWNLNKYFSRS